MPGFFLKKMLCYALLCFALELERAASPTLQKCFPCSPVLDLRRPHYSLAQPLVCAVKLGDKGVFLFFKTFFPKKKRIKIKNKSIEDEPIR